MLIYIKAQKFIVTLLIGSMLLQGCDHPSNEEMIGFPSTYDAASESKALFSKQTGYLAEHVLRGYAMPTAFVSSADKQASTSTGRRAEVPMDMPNASVPSTDRRASTSTGRRAELPMNMPNAAAPSTDREGPGVQFSDNADADSLVTLSEWFSKSGLFTQGMGADEASLGSLSLPSWLDLGSEDDKIVKEACRSVSSNRGAEALYEYSDNSLASVFPRIRRTQSESHVLEGQSERPLVRSVNVLRERPDAIVDNIRQVRRSQSLSQLPQEQIVCPLNLGTRPLRQSARKVAVVNNFQRVSRSRPDSPFPAVLLADSSVGAKWDLVKDTVQQAHI
ncbi:MAG: hypothetical protein ACX93T_02935, partial [Bacteroidota bacterium]